MYTLNIDHNREIALSLGIRSIPTVKMFNSGEVVETKVGMMNEGQIKDLVTELVNG
jgi:thioredoxin-like negative regulator of GroEL